MHDAVLQRVVLPLLIRRGAGGRHPPAGRRPRDGEQVPGSEAAGAAVGARRLPVLSPEQDLPRRRPRLSRRVLAVALAAVALLLVAAVVAVASRTPSHDRDWVPGQEVLPSVTFQDSLVHVRNVRNFRYRTADDFTPGYEDRTYDLRKLERVWFVLSPFAGNWRGPAHAFLSFSFADSQHVSISVEGRREVGEVYSPFKGLLRNYELMYVIGDERDLIALRTLVWKDPVHLYPVKATPEQARKLFVRMLQRAHEIEREPEFYNTILNNCATNIVDAVNTFAVRRIRYSPALLLPGYSDELAMERGLLDTPLPLEEARAAFHINPRAEAAARAEDFSYRIRAYSPPSVPVSRSRLR